jgi:hypothetical protein
MLIFAHIPKSGGNSIFNNIQGNYSDDEVIRYYAQPRGRRNPWPQKSDKGDSFLPRSNTLNYEWWPGSDVPHLSRLEDLPAEITNVRLLKQLKIRFITGHFKDFAQVSCILREHMKAKYFFSSRNPIDMCASHYAMHIRAWQKFRRLGSSSPKAELPRQDRIGGDSLPKAKDFSIIEDWKSGWHLNFWLGSKVVRPLLFFSNSPKPDIKKAIKNVKKACFIFDCDDFAASFKKMEKDLGLKIKDYNLQKNLTKREEYLKIDKESFSGFVKKHLAEDLEFYEECKKISQDL